MTVQAKFWVQNIQHQGPSTSEADPVATVTLVPVYGSDDENATWSKYTPSGKIEMCITNPAAIEQFELGEEYLITFAKAQQSV